MTNQELSLSIKRLLKENQEQTTEENKDLAGAKIGDIFQYDHAGYLDLERGGDDEFEYYILTSSKNPRKPDTVGLWQINPKKMTDSNWKYRKLWNQVKVVDPKNITKQELKDIITNEFAPFMKKVKK